MTEDPGARPSADAEKPDANGEPQDEAPVVSPPARGRRKTVEKATRERLAKWDFFQALDPSAPVQSIFRGASIGRTRGRASAIGDEVGRLGRLFHALTGADAQLTGLAWTNSVRLTFELPERELKRVEKGYREAFRATERAGKTEPNDEELIALRSQVLPDLAVASFMAIELMQTPATHIVERAVELGTGVTLAYRSFANVVARDEDNIELVAPNELERAELTSDRAERVAVALKAAGEAIPLTVVAMGVLSIADATQRGFGLRLDSEAARHPALRGRRLIRGHYTSDAGEKIREMGLWGKEVRATLRVIMDPHFSTSTIRPPVYTLVDVDPRYT